MVLKTLGERLNYCRSLLCKSRKEVADEIGVVSLPTLSRWELNTTKIPLKKIDLLIEYFADNNILISKEWLLKGEGHCPIDGNLQEFNKNNFDDVAVESLFSLKKKIKDFWFSQVSNNFFSPIASFGDYVGGVAIQATKDNFTLLKDKICFLAKANNTFVGTLRVNDSFCIENNRNELMEINSDHLVGEVQWLVKRP